MSLRKYPEGICWKIDSLELNRFRNYSWKSNSSLKKKVFYFRKSNPLIFHKNLLDSFFCCSIYGEGIDSQKLKKWNDSKLDFLTVTIFNFRFGEVVSFHSNMRSLLTCLYVTLCFSTTIKANL